MEVIFDCVSFFALWSPCPTNSHLAFLRLTSPRLFYPEMTLASSWLVRHILVFFPAACSICHCQSNFLKGRSIFGLGTSRILIFSLSLFFFLAVPRGMQDLPQPGIEPVPPALGAQSLNYWTVREVPLILFCVLSELLPDINSLSKWLPHPTPCVGSRFSAHHFLSTPPTFPPLPFLKVLLQPEHLSSLLPACSVSLSPSRLI